MLIYACYVLELTAKEHAFEIEDELRQCTREEALTRVLGLAGSRCRQTLDLNRDNLVKLVDVTKSLVEMIHDYVPRGDVETMDVFYAQNSGRVPQILWVKEYLSKWGEFTRTGVRLHEGEGTHEDMMSTKQIISFQGVFKTVLRERGI